MLWHFVYITYRDRYQCMDDDVDLVVIAAGTNDWSYADAPVGTFEDRIPTTFYGALHLLCLGLLDKYLGKQIVFMTPIKRYEIDQKNRNGLKQVEYADIIKEVCAYYSIPVLDMWRESGLNCGIPSQADYYFTDGPGGGHPNQNGHEKMAQRVSGYLRQLK